jgi:putative ABC transport system permease protein
VKWTGLEAPDEGTVYSPFVDFPQGYFVLRAGGNPAASVAALREAVRELDPGLAVSSVATGRDLVDSSLAAPRYLSVLVSMFALAALLLSVIGIYGVMAFFVEQHTRDIGIRLAIGGEPSAVQRMIILQGWRLVGVGTVVGTGAAFVATRFLTAVLYDVARLELTAIAVVPIALMLSGLVACMVPGRRAARLDPAAILRES